MTREQLGLSPDDESEPNAEADAQPNTVPARRTRAPRQVEQFPDDEERILATLRTMPPDARTRLKRVNDSTKRFETHGILSPDEVSSEWVAKRFGGGKYVVEVLERNARGQEVVKTSATWYIPGPYLGVGPGLPGINASASARAADAPQVAGSTPGVGGAPVATRELIDSAMTSRLLDILNRDRSPGMDWNGVAAMIGALGAIATPIIVALLERKGDDPALAEIRRELAAFKNRGPAAGAINDATKSIKDILALKELLTPSEVPGASTGERVLAALPQILAALNPGAAAPAAAIAPASDGSATPQPAPAGPMTLDDMLKAFKDQLLHLARSGWEPDFCASFVVRALPQEYAGMLAEFLHKPDAQAIAIRAIPELATFETWLPEFLRELRAEMNPTDDEDAEQ